MSKIKTITLLVLLTLIPSIAPAQLLNFNKSEPAEKFNSELIPHSAFTTAAIFPQRIAKNPALKLAPWEVITAWGESDFGFDPMLLKQVTWMLDTPADMSFGQGPPAWALVLHFEKLQGLSDKLIGNLTTKTIGGKTVYSPANPWEVSYLIYDESTIVIGDERMFESMLTADGNNPLLSLADQTKVTGQAIGFIDVAAIRSLLDEAMSAAEYNLNLPPELVALKKLSSLLKSIEMGADAENKFETKIILHAINPAAAEEVAELLADAGQVIKRQILTSVAGQTYPNDPVQVATVQYTNRLFEKYAIELTPKIDGSNLTIIANEEIVAVPLLFSMLVGDPSRESFFAQKMTPEIQLRTVALAFHNYESAYTKFPAPVIKSEDGRPLFNGAVAMFPFMEQHNLYDQLKLDEPWDSPHNRQFTETAIESISDASGKLGAATMIRFPVFPNSIWDEENPATGFGDLPDGTSNTILTIMAPERAAVSWADPTPWRISKNNPMADVFGDREEVHVGMADGSTRILRKSEMTNAKLSALLTRDGGEVID